MIERKIFRQLRINCSRCNKLVHEVTAVKPVIVSIYTIEPYSVKCKECAYDDR